MNDTLTSLRLVRGEHTVTILPHLGASLAGWHVGETALLDPVSDPNLAAQRGVAIAAYPLVPYSNRIANAEFGFGGEHFSLAHNFVSEANSIHGNAWERAWTVGHSTVDRAILILDHRPDATEDGVDYAAQWPYAYRAALSYALADDGLDVELVIENRDTRDQPAGFGFHPFFPRDGRTRIAFEAEGVWLSDAAGLPEAKLPTEGEWSFSQPRDVSQRRIDNCFSGWGRHARIDWPDRMLSMTIDADAVFGHCVVFTAPEKPFVAFEPVTNMNDAIHHPEIPDRGLHILKPGGLLQGRIRFRLARPHG